MEKPIYATKSDLIIGSKFDTDLESNLCRLAFFGHIVETKFNDLKVFDLYKVSRQK